jgi:hypothetical protein
MTIESRTAAWLSVFAILVISVLVILLAAKGGDTEKLASGAFSAIGTIVGFTAGHHLGSSGRTKVDKRVDKAMVLLHGAGVDEAKISSIFND